MGASHTRTAAAGDRGLARARGELERHGGRETRNPYRARRFFDRYRVRDTDLIVTGGLRTPADFTKAIATSAMMAIGCQQYRACHGGNCPVGIATRRSDLRERFDVDTATLLAGNFLSLVRDQLADYCRVLGKREIHTLAVEDLVTTDSEISDHTGVEPNCRATWLHLPGGAGAARRAGEVPAYQMLTSCLYFHLGPQVHGCVASCRATTTAAGFRLEVAREQAARLRLAR